MNWRRGCVVCTRRPSKACCSSQSVNTLSPCHAMDQVFCAHVQTLAKQSKKQVVPEGLYDALIAVVDLLQKLVRTVATQRWLIA